MLGWYGDAKKCYVYLSDVSVRKGDNIGEPHRWLATRLWCQPVRRKVPGERCLQDPTHPVLQLEQGHFGRHPADIGT